MFPRDGNHLSSVGQLAVGVQENAKSRERVFSFRFRTLATACNHQGERQEQIGVESLTAAYHSASKQSKTLAVVKRLMSKQSNKVEKRKRRVRYLKRKKMRQKPKVAPPEPEVKAA